MCGRYHVETEEENIQMREIMAELNRRNLQVKTGEIAPGMSAPVLLMEDGKMRPGAMRWGARGVSGMVINARSETAMQKPMFRHSAVNRRLLLPMSGFYEWKHIAGGRRGTKYACRPASGSILYMAGLYLPTMDGMRFVVLTRAADGQIARLHDRMPLFIEQAAMEEWLSGELSAWDAAVAAAPPLFSVAPDEPEQLSLF